jgi:DNA polymerase-1
MNKHYRTPIPAHCLSANNLDFEYYRQNGKVFPVCVAVGYGYDVISYWLLDPIQREKFLESLSSIKVIRCYSAAAEASALLALGVDPTRFEWRDMYVAYRQARNHNPRYMYGKIKRKDGSVIVSKPVEWDDDASYEDNADEQEISHKKVGASLASAVLNLLNVDIDTAHKTLMRDIIINGKGNYTDEQRQQILEYCESDLTYLNQLDEMFPSVLNMKPATYGTAILKHSMFHVDMAVCTNKGYPLNRRRLENLTGNYGNILNAAREEANKHHTFYEKSKTGYTRKQKNFADYVSIRGWHDWPRTDKGALKTDEKTLDNYAGDAGIAQLKATAKLMKQIQSFRPEVIHEFMDNVCSEYRLHHDFGVFGTQTGRNAPPARLFVFAMSSWLRALISPKSGRAITGNDWASQEFAVAAHLSQDQNMLDAYNSGDPYAYFAQQAGAIPSDLSIEEAKKQYRHERDLFKSTILGLQYGMGVEKLSNKLSTDTGSLVTYNEAMHLRNQHRYAFRRYWEWLEELKYQHADYDQPPLHTADKWVLYRDSQQPITSVLNFPTQATSATILRLAVRKAHQAGLCVLAPLHDAIYIEHDEGDTTSPETLSKAMHDAVSEVLPGLVIRQEAKTLTSKGIWVEPKGKAMLKLLLPYIDPTVDPLSI